MKFSEAVKHCLQNYVNFSGRAPRSEYWFFVLFMVGAMVIAGILDGAITGGILGSLVSLGLFLPCIAVGVRRLHDLDKSGWWYLLVFIPIIGSLVLLFWYVQKGTDGANSFGEDPLNGSAVPVKRAL